MVASTIYRFEEQLKLSTNLGH